MSDTSPARKEPALPVPARLQEMVHDAITQARSMGAEAVEAAFKLARWHTKRELNIAFFGAFHGRTMGALSLTASKTVQKKNYNPLVPGITHIPYAYCYRCAYNLTYPKCGLYCVRWVEDTLFRTTVPPEEVA